MAAFKAIADAGYHATLFAWQQGGAPIEYSLDLGAPYMTGLLHEDIERLLEVARDHSGRLWLDRQDHRLAMVFTPPSPQGPDGQESAAHGGEALHPQRNPQRRMGKGRKAA